MEIFNSLLISILEFIVGSICIVVTLLSVSKFLIRPLFRAFDVIAAARISIENGLEYSEEGIVLPDYPFTAYPELSRYCWYIEHKERYGGVFLCLLIQKPFSKLIKKYAFNLRHRRLIKANVPCWMDALRTIDDLIYPGPHNRKLSHLKGAWEDRGIFISDHFAVYQNHCDITRYYVRLGIDGHWVGMSKEELLQNLEKLPDIVRYEWNLSQLV